MIALTSHENKVAVIESLKNTSIAQAQILPVIPLAEGVRLEFNLTNSKDFSFGD